MQIYAYFKGGWPRENPGTSLSKLRHQAPDGTKSMYSLQKINIIVNFRNIYLGESPQMRNIRMDS